MFTYWNCWNYRIQGAVFPVKHTHFRFGIVQAFKSTKIYRYIYWYYFWIFLKMQNFRNFRNNDCLHSQNLSFISYSYQGHFWRCLSLFPAPKSHVLVYWKSSIKFPSSWLILMYHPPFPPVLLSDPYQHFRIFPSSVDTFCWKFKFQTKQFVSSELHM